MRIVLSLSSVMDKTPPPDQEEVPPINQSSEFVLNKEDIDEEEEEVEEVQQDQNQQHSPVEDSVNINNPNYQDLEEGTGSGTRAGDIELGQVEVEKPQAGEGSTRPTYRTKKSK